MSRTSQLVPCLGNYVGRGCVGNYVGTACIGRVRWATVESIQVIDSTCKPLQGA
jgi:hypothetical protein